MKASEANALRGQLVLLDGTFVGYVEAVVVRPGASVEDDADVAIIMRTPMDTLPAQGKLSLLPGLTVTVSLGKSEKATEADLLVPDKRILGPSGQPLC